MKRMPLVLCSVAFAIGIVFFACSNEKSDDGTVSSSSEYGSYSSSSNAINGDSSSSQDPAGDGSSSSLGSSGDSSSSSNNLSSSSSGSSSSGVSSSSSSSSVNTGANCAYKPSWCNDMAFSEIVTGPFSNGAHSTATSINNGEIGGDNDPPEHQHCLFVKDFSELGNHNAAGSLLVNGQRISQDGRCGHTAWNQPTCANALATVNMQKADGGYYIYVEKWAGYLTTTGGTPVCNGTGGGGNTSSASVVPSSSSVATGGITGGCIAPPGDVPPPNGKETCIKVGTSCYICNPDRGNECLSTWLWTGNQVDQEWWFTKVSCDEAGGGSSSSAASTLTCTGLAASGIAGTAISQPTVKCNTTALTSGITWTGAPTWDNPTASTYNVSATASCGGSNKTASCGTLIVSPAPSTDQLTCTGMTTTGIAGTAITQPTVKCGNTALTSGITWTGAPDWSNPTVSTYNVSATASCGGSNKTASCGTLKVSPKLTCGLPTPTSVIAGTAVTPPTVSCGGTEVRSGISWTGQPATWSAPTQGTYNIQAGVTSGDCSGQTATCGTLTVNPKLTCGDVTQTITTAQVPINPQLTCGGTAVTSGITWTPNINNTLTTASSPYTVTAQASCGGSTQTATCSGKITVTAAVSSSSVTVPSSSSASGSTSYPPLQQGQSGVQTAVTTRYWDACKPSCAWSGKPVTPICSSCSANGSKISDGGMTSSCNGGGAYTCMTQAPWKINDNLSYGFAATAAANGDQSCGKCYQLQFTSTGISGKTMIVKASNIGTDVSSNHFDIMIPGGGVGQFNALSTQIQQSGATANLGATYGGFRATCGADATCIRNMCDSNFKNLPDLKAGCYWYIDWYGMADNPSVLFKEVTCPAELNAKW